MFLHWEISTEVCFIYEGYMDGELRMDRGCDVARASYEASICICICIYIYIYTLYSIRLGVNQLQVVTVGAFSTHVARIRL